jgi:hypothetical protein
MDIVVWLRLGLGKYEAAFRESTGMLRSLFQS